ncbi:hypothetical protein WN943_011669 [Citrus x changshan-huyou]|nr:hypothetical protein CUMW_190840 [Citrus unshiu]
MSQVGKLETIVEVKAPAAKIHKVFSCRPHIVTIGSPESVESCELLEGERGKPGCVICWRFCGFYGLRTTWSFTVRLFRCHYIGETQELSIQLLKVTPKDKGSLVHWTSKYERQNEDVHCSS